MRDTHAQKWIWPLAGRLGWAIVRAFVVRLQSGVRYWTVVDEDLQVHREADGFLQHVRFGRGCAESTTRDYATATALYLVWCRQVYRDWRDAADRAGAFMLWLRRAPGLSAGEEVFVRPDVVVRQPARINAALVAVREFLKHAVASGDAPP